MLVKELKERLKSIPDNANVYISYSIDGNDTVIDAETIRSSESYVCIEG